jgi:hypothetical protein
MQGVFSNRPEQNAGRIFQIVLNRMQDDFSNRPEQNAGRFFKSS